MERKSGNIGHPNDFVGPLQMGQHNWYEEEGLWLEISEVTSMGHQIIAWAGTEEERKARFEKYCRIIEARVERTRRSTHGTAGLLGRILDEPMSY
jgi:hypothetical protein